MNKQLQTKLFLQNPKYSFCSLNAMRTICDYYLDSPPSRDKLRAMLKTDKRTGTYFHDIQDTVSELGIKHRYRKTMPFKDIVKTIDSKNLIMFSYQSGVGESHSSIICGYSKRRGVPYVNLCDSWIGHYEIPYTVLNVLFKADIVDGGRAIFFKESL